MDRRRIVLVAIGGAVGATLRWALLDAAHDTYRPALLLANVAGSLVLGAAVALPVRPGRLRHAVLHDAVGIGFCGGLTTFSSLAVEVAELGRGDRLAFGAGYLALTVVLGIGAAVLGAAVAGRVQALDEPLEGEA